MKTISPYSYAAIMIAIKLFLLTSYAASGNENAAVTGVTAAAFSLVKLISLIPLFIIFKRNDKAFGARDIFRSKAASKISCLFFAAVSAYFIFAVADMFSTLIGSIYPDRFTKLGVTAVLFIAFAYAASMGIAGVSRAAAISSVVFIAVLLVIFSGMRQNMLGDRINLYSDDLAAQTASVLKSFAFCTVDHFVFFGLLPYLDRSPLKAAGIYTAADILITLPFFLIGASIMGSFWGSSGYSFFTVSCSTSGMLIDRSDGVFLAVSAASALICGAALFIILTRNLMRLFKIKHEKTNAVYLYGASAFTAAALSLIHFGVKPQKLAFYVGAASSCVLFAASLFLSVAQIVGSVGSSENRTISAEEK